MTLAEFTRQLDDIRQQIAPGSNSGAVSVGDALEKKLQALKQFEQLVSTLEKVGWNDTERMEAVKSVVGVRAAIESMSDYEAVQVKLGRVLADTGGVKEKGDAYSRDGKVSHPVEAPSTRVNRIT